MLSELVRGEALFSKPRTSTDDEFIFMLASQTPLVLNFCVKTDNKAGDWDQKNKCQPLQDQQNHLC